MTIGVVAPGAVVVAALQPGGAIVVRVAVTLVDATLVVRRAASIDARPSEAGRDEISMAFAVAS